MERHHIQLLLVSDSEEVLRFVEGISRSRGYRFSVARTASEALEILSRDRVDVALVADALPGFSGLQILEQIKKDREETEAILFSSHGEAEGVVSLALKRGAYDFLGHPLEHLERLEFLIEKALEKVALVRKVKRFEKGEGRREEYAGMIGKSEKMQEVYALIENVAATLSSVLITGESGTGKELVARALHRKSERKEGPFVVLNCAAVPETLLESELFGYERGAFTGALKRKSGKLEEANGGTIFLDEIGELAPPMQVKLMRVLQDGEIRRVGGRRVFYSDARIITATNRDLAALVKKKSFREDLYYRLNVITIALPPLREKKEDIPLLAYHFLSNFARQTGKKVSRIAVDALQSLQAYPWPGNVRELENVIERAVVLTRGNVLTAKDLPPKILGEVFYVAEEEDGELTKLPYQEAKEKALQLFNRNYVVGLLKQFHGNLSLASLRAGMDRSNFKKIVKKIEINVKEFKKGA